MPFFGYLIKVLSSELISSSRIASTTYLTQVETVLCP